MGERRCRERKSKGRGGSRKLGCECAGSHQLKAATCASGGLCRPAVADSAANACGTVTGGWLQRRQVRVEYSGEAAKGRVLFSFQGDSQKAGGLFGVCTIWSKASNPISRHVIGCGAGYFSHCLQPHIKTSTT